MGLEPDEWKALIGGILNSVLIPKKPLISLYNEIQWECSRTDLVPSEIQRNIDSRIATLPKEYRQQFREFVKNRVTLPEELMDHKNYLGKRYEGRRQMDYYLNKAGLMGTLI